MGGTEIFCHRTHRGTATGRAGQLIDWLMSQVNVSISRTVWALSKNTREKSGRTEWQPTKQKNNIKNRQKEKTRWIETLFLTQNQTIWHGTSQTKSWPATVGFKRPPQGQFVFIIYQKLRILLLCRRLLRTVTCYFYFWEMLLSKWQTGIWDRKILKSSSYHVCKC